MKTAMTRKMLIVIFAVAVLESVPGSAAANPIPLFNTGAGIAEGQADQHFYLLSGPTCPAGGCNVYAMVNDGFPFPPYIPNSPTSAWIEPVSGTTDTHPVGTYVYRTTFSLDGLDPTTALISGAYSSDNALVDVLLNGVSLGLINAWDRFGTFTPFLIPDGFIAGLNTLDFVIDNAFCPTCGRNPTALRVEMNGTADAAPITNPEPASLVLLGSGLLGTLLARRRSRRRSR